MRLLLLLLALITAAPAQAFWVDKRDVCAQAAAGHSDLSQQELRKIWNQLGIQRSFETTYELARYNVISNFCQYFVLR